MKRTTMIINKVVTFGFFLLIFMHSSLGIVWEDEDTVIVEAAQEIDASEGVRWKRQFPGFPSLQPPGWPPGGIFGGGIFGQRPGINPGFPGSSGKCFTQNGDEGTCKSMRQCFPILYYSDDLNNVTAIRNPPLFEVYQASTTPCLSSGFFNHIYRSGDADSRQSGYICCPKKKPSGIKVTTQKPFIPTQRTTQRPWLSTNRPGPIMGGPGGHRPPSRPTTTTTTTTTTTMKPPRQQVPTTTRPIPGWPRPPETVTTTTTKAPYRESSCGRPNIVGGSEAQAGMYPWVVSIVNNRKHLCGGSLIDSRHVLTAAHCIVTMTPGMVSNLIILLGDHDLSNINEAKHEVRRVKSISRHANYHHGTFQNDIAILTLSQDVDFRSNIKPICLNQGQAPYDTGNMMATVAGWGSTQYQTEPVAVLRHVSMRIWTNSECAQKYAQSMAQVQVISTQVCAASPGKDACRGDSGGPLVIQRNGIFEQIGIVSWGIECGTYPGVYTRVDKFKDWISKNRRL